MKFMNYRYLFLLFSACVIIPGLISLFRYGLRPSIDFTGGSLLEISLQVPDSSATHNIDSFQKILGENYPLSSVQQSGASQYILRSKPQSEAQKGEALTLIQKQLGPVEELRFESVGPLLGRELLAKTLLAGAIVCLFITFYIGYQFHSLKFGICAVLAMLHDSLVMLGIFSLLGHYLGVEVDVLFMTALLTVLSFSIHDTIVVFDRIREMSKRHRSTSFRVLVDAAVLETLGRSLNNSMTIIIMLVSLVLLGGATIHWFAVALLIGAITGTYSSTFTAAPLLVIWDEVADAIRKRSAVARG